MSYMGPARLHWADSAKAIAVILVVLYHVSPTALGWMLEESNQASTYTSALSQRLSPVRMPLFFLVSGLLSRRAVQRSWSTEIPKKVLNLFWVFFFWTLFYAGFYVVAMDLTGIQRLRPFVWSINFDGAYWYLPMLAIFFIVSKALRRVNVLWILLGALLLRMLAVNPFMAEGFIFFDLGTTILRFMTFFMWYAVGLFGVKTVDLLVNASKYLWIPAITIYAYIGLFAYPEDLGKLYSLALSVVGIVAMLGVVQILVMSRWLRKLFRYVAGRTLPIYLFHALILVIARGQFDSIDSLSVPQTYLLVFGLTAFLVAVSCLAWDVLRPRFPLLFRAPSLKRNS